MPVVGPKVTMFWEPSNLKQVPRLPYPCRASAVALGLGDVHVPINPQLVVHKGDQQDVSVD